VRALRFLLDNNRSLSRHKDSKLSSKKHLDVVVSRKDALPHRL
jgi:hypothetical protein